MKKILFVTLGHLSAGEFTIAFEFCKRLPAQQYEVCFLTSEKGQKYLEKNQIKHTVLYRSGPAAMSEDKVRNKAITDQVIAEFQPDYIIASDVYTLWYSYSWSGVSLEILREYGVPVGSIDSYEFGSTDYVQDYYGGYKATLPRFIEECDFVIRYCPINKVTKADPRVKFTYFFDGATEASEEEKQHFDRTFRPTGEEKVIFMANSDWESLNVNRLPALTNLLKWIPRIILNYLALLEGKITVIHVGPQRWEVEDGVLSRLTYHHFNFLSPQEFDHYLASADLFLTTNIISSTLAKAVYAAVPAVVLQNDKLINFSNLGEQLKQLPVWYQEMAEDVKIAYPFRLFPFGWFNFLKPVLENNPYVETFVQTSLFQKNKTLRTLQTYLYDADACSALQARQKEYIQEILCLPNSADVIDSLEDR